VPPLGIQTKDVAAAIVRVNERHPGKPMLAVLMGRQGLPAGLAELHESRIPAYIFPESAARALAAMWHFRQNIDRPEGRLVAFDTDDAAVAAILDATLAAGHTKLSEPDALRVLEAYGIPTAPWAFVPSAGSGSLASRAAEAADDLGFPVALKVVSPAVVHKTEVGGVALGLKSKSEVERTVRDMVKRVESAVAERGPETPPHEPARRGTGPVIEGVLLQAMATGGTETIVGLTRIPRVGALVMFGLGGIYVEVMRDVVLRLAPLVDSDAEQMIREVKMFPLLAGARGSAPRDLKSLADTVLRISQLSERHPRIAEMDINPLVALPHGVMAVDARIQLA